LAVKTAKMRILMRTRTTLTMMETRKRRRVATKRLKVLVLLQATRSRIANSNDE
jgi:hypothetical protein